MKPAAPMIQILIATEQKIFGHALAGILSADPLFRVIAQCNDTGSAIAITGNQQPDIVLLDAESDRAAAINTVKRITCSSNARVIALSMYPDEGYKNNMLTAGATGYVSKMSPPAEILLAVHEVAKGNVYVCNENNIPSSLQLLPLQKIHPLQ